MVFSVQSDRLIFRGGGKKQMFTSNFDIYKGEHAVSIAGECPKWYKGKEYKKLAPKRWFYDIYKQTGDIEFYKKHYYEEILSKLDARQVYEELGENAVLLCWEHLENPDEQFCHRRLVAEWLEEELGISIPELRAAA
jgi:hypothetical protein